MWLFRDRQEAAYQLAKSLAHYRGRSPLVLAIPRGAVPMGKILAEQLDGELDVVLVRKLRAPYRPELAVGAIDEEGNLLLAEHSGRLLKDPDYLMAEKQAQLQTLRTRRALYTPVRAPTNPAHRVVIVIDDGIATGSTMLAALRFLRAKTPARLIAATAVAPFQALAQIEAVADEVVCLATPEPFYSIGQFFADFHQIADDEVVELLKPTAVPALEPHYSAP